MKALVGLIVLFGSGCQYVTLDRASPQADRITDLHWWMFWIMGVVWWGVIGSLAVGLRRPRRDTTSAEAARRRFRAVGAATAVSVLMLIGLLIGSIAVGRFIAAPAPAADTLDVRVIGHQWWWEVRYPSNPPDLEVTTANEIHVPAGRTIRFHLETVDVIHSLWIPNLNGKKDLIPGRINTLTFRVRRPGVYEGRCAEFCGYQHAHMGLLLVAESPKTFEEWLAAQRRSSVEPEDAVAQHGREVFVAGPCATCHTIRGTGAFGHRAPDLTHLASRATIAAATLPNSTGHLAGWVADSQRIKPGNRMPPNFLSSSDLTDVVAYLGSLR